MPKTIREEIEALVASLGVAVEVEQIESRAHSVLANPMSHDHLPMPPNGYTAGWGDGATHWDIKLTREGCAAVRAVYSMGSAHKGEPAAADILASLAHDVSAAEGDFDEFLDCLQLTDDSRYAHALWEHMQLQVLSLREMLGGAALMYLQGLAAQL